MCCLVLTRCIALGITPSGTIPAHGPRIALCTPSDTNPAYGPTQAPTLLLVLSQRTALHSPYLTSGTNTAYWLTQPFLTDLVPPQDVRLDLVQSMSQPDSPPLPASASSAALSPALRAAAYAARMGLLGRPPPLRAGSSRSDHDGSHGGHNGYRDHGHSNSNHGHNSSHGHVHAPSQAGPGGGVTLGPASNSSSTGRCQSPPQSQLDPSPAERPAPLEASSPGPAGPTLGHWQATGSGGSPEARDPELDSEPVMGVAGTSRTPSLYAPKPNTCTHTFSAI